MSLLMLQEQILACIHDDSCSTWNAFMMIAAVHGMVKKYHLCGPCKGAVRVRFGHDAGQPLGSTRCQRCDGGVAPAPSCTRCHLLYDAARLQHILRRGGKALRSVQPVHMSKESEVEAVCMLAQARAFAYE